MCRTIGSLGVMSWGHWAQLRAVDGRHWEQWEGLKGGANGRRSHWQKLCAQVHLCLPS